MRNNDRGEGKRDSERREMKAGEGKDKRLEMESIGEGGGRDNDREKIEGRR